jgi:chromosome segregation ATPase
MAPRTTPASTEQIARWMGSVDETLKTLKERVDEQGTDAKKHRESLQDVIAALSLSVRDLANELAMQKPIAAGHQELRNTVSAQASQIATLTNDVAALKTTVSGFQERYFEQRGAIKYGVTLATVIKYLLGISGLSLAALGGFFFRSH